MNYITCSYNEITILLFRNIRLYKILFRVKAVVLLKNDHFNPIIFCFYFSAGLSASFGQYGF